MTRKEGSERCSVAALKMEERAMSQGMWVASSSWKRQGNKCSLEPPKKNAALVTPGF